MSAARRMPLKPEGNRYAQDEKEQNSIFDRHTCGICISCRGLRHGDKGTPEFEALQKANPEAYAWITFTDTNISFPVLQSASDTAYYLSHDLYGEEDDNGCIYTELYNHTDFNDHNTVISGRNTDAMFGRLHQFADRDFFDEHRQIQIFLPDRVYLRRQASDRNI